MPDAAYVQAARKQQRYEKVTEMNFEIIDNLLQTVVFLVCVAVAFVLAVKKRHRSLMILAFAYGSFMMGTLFYVLHIVITGHNPKIFYVSEVSWIASYLFIFSIALLRNGSSGFYLIPALVSVPMGLIPFLIRVFGPSIITSGIFALIAYGITYFSICGIKKRNTQNCFAEIVMIMAVFFQILLFIVSIFTVEYTSFNLYFAVDIALTACLVALIPILYAEDNIK